MFRLAGRADFLSLWKSLSLSIAEVVLRLEERLSWLFLPILYAFGPGRAIINISSSNGEERNVSFDFYAENDPLVHIIDKRDIKYVEQSLSSVYKGLETISRNQQFHI